MWRHSFSKTCRIRIPAHVVREILKINLRLSFKKGKSRPFGICKDKQWITKGLFAVRLTKALSKFQILVNIDETLLSRYTKATHSWLAKGKECSVSNIWIVNSTSLITAITPTGSVFAAVTRGSVTANTFEEFLKNLDNFTSSDWGWSLQDWLILMDNAATHRSKTVKGYVEEQKLNIAFIPTYSPEWAPIEKYFSLLKRIIVEKRRGRTTNFKTQSSMDLIGKSMEYIPQAAVTNLWRNLMSELRSTIDRIGNLL